MKYETLAIMLERSTVRCQASALQHVNTHTTALPALDVVSLTYAYSRTVYANS